MNKPRKVEEVVEEFSSIKRPVPMKVSYLFSELCEIVAEKDKELNELRMFKNEVEKQHLRKI